MPVLRAVEVPQDLEAQMAPCPMVLCPVRFVGQTVVQAAVSCSLTLRAQGCVTRAFPRQKSKIKRFQGDAC